MLMDKLLSVLCCQQVKPSNKHQQWCKQHILGRGPTPCASSASPAAQPHHSCSITLSPLIGLHAHPSLLLGSYQES
jgi:hypothetical protein